MNSQKKFRQETNDDGNDNKERKEKGKKRITRRGAEYRKLTVISWADLRRDDVKIESNN